MATAGEGPGEKVFSGRRGRRIALSVEASFPDRILRRRRRSSSFGRSAAAGKTAEDGGGALRAAEPG
jgi:hypothetical protein